MKYEFYEDKIEKLPNDMTKYIKGKDYYVPLIDFKILDKDYKILESVGRLSGEYVKKIVGKMEQVRDGELDIYGFGPQDSVYVEVAGPTFHREDFRNKCYITRAFDKDFNMTVSFDEIYILMRDYRNEIVKWEEKTGMEKPGW